MAKARPTVVYLKWVDSMHISGWLTLSEVRVSEPESLEHETVGFLYKETPYSYAVIQSKGYDLTKSKNIDAIMEIPKRAVTEFREYLPGKKPRAALPSISDGLK